MNWIQARLSSYKSAAIPKNVNCKNIPYPNRGICVVYFRKARVGCWADPKAGQNTFLGRFQDISHLSFESKKKFLKNSFLASPQSCSAPKRWSTPWGCTLTLSYLVDFSFPTFFVFLSVYFVVIIYNSSCVPWFGAHT